MASYSRCRAYKLRRSGLGSPGALNLRNRRCSARRASPLRFPPSRKGMDNRMAKATPIGENRLLIQIGADDLAVLQPNLKRVPLVRGTVLHPPARRIDQVYFPISGMVSLLAV